MTKTIKKSNMHYCIGCGHTTVHNIIGQIIDELDIREKTIGSAPVGCAVLLYNYFDIDIIDPMYHIVYSDHSDTK